MRDGNDTQVWIAFAVFALIAIPAVAGKALPDRPPPIPAAAVGYAPACEKASPDELRLLPAPQSSTLRSTLFVRGYYE
jgi:hypothetical protein